MNTTKRTHVIVPSRIKYLNAVKETAAVWDEKDHLEFKDGLDKWVEKMRHESEGRLKE
ncbi:MAG: hypothetical protein H5T85_07345 [Actinobacteria bacterium]|nr:hypothetical protein [Actinomycetota bacterium]